MTWQAFERLFRESKEIRVFEEALDSWAAVTMRNSMKIEIGNTKPDNFIDRWPGEFNIFSHFEMALGIPHALFSHYHV